MSDPLIILPSSNDGPFYIREHNARHQKDIHEELKERYTELRAGPRKWSHKTTCAILDGCNAYFNRRGPVWPLVYRKEAESWWKRRTGETFEAKTPLPEIKPILARQQDQWDILDGREVVRLWKNTYASVAVKNRSCGKGCLRSGGICYIMVHDPFMNRFKVGKTFDKVTTRSRNLSCQAGIPIKSLGFVNLCCYAFAGHIEGISHRLLSERRILGEWFRADTLEEVQKLALDLKRVSRPLRKREKELGYGTAVVDRIRSLYS